MAPGGAKGEIMLARSFMSLGVALVLAGCGTNFTLRNTNGLVALHPAEGYAKAEDPRELVEKLVALRVERTASGVIVHASGMPARQGYWEAELVPSDEKDHADGVAHYDFRVFSSAPGTRTGTPHSRKIHVAAFLSNAELAKVRRIRVQAATNSMVARR